MQEKKAERLAVLTIIIVLIILQIAINHISKVSAEQIQKYNIEYVGKQ
jgi:hypothetical protein